MCSVASQQFLSFPKCSSQARVPPNSLPFLLGDLGREEGGGGERRWDGEGVAGGLGLHKSGSSGERLGGLGAAGKRVIGCDLQSACQFRGHTAGRGSGRRRGLPERLVRPTDSMKPLGVLSAFRSFLETSHSPSV